MVKRGDTPLLRPPEQYPIKIGVANIQEELEERSSGRAETAPPLPARRLGAGKYALEGVAVGDKRASPPNTKLRNAVRKVFQELIRSRLRIRPCTSE
jgi:hypothetical protein